MATEIKYLEGTVKWNNLYKPDEAFNTTFWKVQFYPDNVKEVEATGTQINPKEDADGTYYVFRRDEEKKIGKKFIKFAPPTISGKVNISYRHPTTGAPIYSWDMFEDTSLGDYNTLDRVGQSVIIGHGSRVRVRLSVYDTQKGKGTRLEGLEVLDLVEYNREEPSDSTATESAPEAPKAPEGPVSKKTKKPAPWD